MGEEPQVGDFVRISNAPDLIEVLLVLVESSVIVTKQHLRFNNGYTTNQFPFSSITYLVRDIDFEDVSLTSLLDE